MIVQILVHDLIIIIIRTVILKLSNNFILKTITKTPNFIILVVHKKVGLRMVRMKSRTNYLNVGCFSHIIRREDTKLYLCYLLADISLVVLLFNHDSIFFTSYPDIIRVCIRCSPLLVPLHTLEMKINTRT